MVIYIVNKQSLADYQSLMIKAYPINDKYGDKLLKNNRCAINFLQSIGQK